MKTEEDHSLFKALLFSLLKLLIAQKCNMVFLASSYVQWSSHLKVQRMTPTHNPADKGSQQGLGNQIISESQNQHQEAMRTR
jgi:hypothetical protein